MGHKTRLKDTQNGCNYISQRFIRANVEDRAFSYRARYDPHVDHKMVLWLIYEPFFTCRVNQRQIF